MKVVYFFMENKSKKDTDYLFPNQFGEQLGRPDLTMLVHSKA